jgi:hypothetical protein
MVGETDIDLVQITGPGLVEQKVGFLKFRVPDGCIMGD